MPEGTYIYPPEPSLRLVSDIFAFAGREVPKWNTISISGYHMREAGCDAIQEVAFTLANGIEYVKTAVESGLDVDDFAGQLSFFFNGHNYFLEEVAKFRAARKLWSSIMSERFGAKTAKARALRFHCQTAGVTLTAQQPMNNVVRVALQAMAAVLGGAQSLHTNSFDEALGLPTEEAVTIALRTQQIIAHESGVRDIVDPFAGSYAVETLTRRIEDGARDYIARIDAMGGMVRAIEQGFVQRDIQATAYAYQLDIENKRRIVVGMNEFESEGAQGARRQDRSARRGRAGRAPRAFSRRARPRAGRAGARTSRTGGADQGQLGAAGPRCGARQRDGGRDQQRAAQGVGGIRRAAVDLTPPAAVPKKLADTAEISGPPVS